MTKGKHRNDIVKRSPLFICVSGGSACVIAGAGLLIASVAELLRYSPYGDPGAGQAGLWTGIAAVILIAVPAGSLAVWGAARLVRRYLAWLRTLTPGQRLAASVIEFGVMEGVHYVWHEHNKRESARLTASVMGPERKSHELEA